MGTEFILGFRSVVQTVWKEELVDAWLSGSWLADWQRSSHVTVDFRTFEAFTFGMDCKSLLRVEGACPLRGSGAEPGGCPCGTPFCCHSVIQGYPVAVLYNSLYRAPDLCLPGLVSQSKEEALSPCLV